KIPARRATYPAFLAPKVSRTSSLCGAMNTRTTGPPGAPCSATLSASAISLSPIVHRAFCIVHCPSSILHSAFSVRPSSSVIRRSSSVVRPPSSLPTNRVPPQRRPLSPPPAPLAEIHPPRVRHAALRPRGLWHPVQVGQNCGVRFHPA